MMKKHLSKLLAIASFAGVLFFYLFSAAAEISSVSFDSQPANQQTRMGKVGGIEGVDLLLNAFNKGTYGSPSMVFNTTCLTNQENTYTACLPVEYDIKPPYEYCPGSRIFIGHVWVRIDKWQSVSMKQQWDYGLPSEPAQVVYFPVCFNKDYLPN